MEIIDRFANSILFWSAWMVIPFIMEVLPSIGSIIVLFKRKIKPIVDIVPTIYPEISIIVPVYNSEATLENCIRSIYESDYPNDRIRVFLVNNKTRDNSFRVFSECQEKYPELIMQWLNAQQGKSRALNLALYNSEGKYIIHIDSDGMLEKTALRHMVERFETDLSVNCMTGAICTNPDMIEEYPRGFARIFRKLEFMEYAQAFLAGRNYASERNAIYTLSGAFSAFRKSAILKSRLYSTDTICEDTHITFQMKYIQNEKVKICEKAIFFVDPIEDVDKLYTQRQRWQRGSLEVTKMFMNFGLNPLKMLVDHNVRTIMYDHTFAFPRLIWYLALICLLCMGFSGKIIGLSMAGIFLMYIICGYFYYFVITGFLSEFDDLCEYYKKQWWVVMLLPVFNLIVFFIRMAGIINSIEADSAWKTRTLTDEKNDFKDKVRTDFKWLISAMEKVRGAVNEEPGKIEDRAKKSAAWYIFFNFIYLTVVSVIIAVNWIDTSFSVGINEVINTVLQMKWDAVLDITVSALRYCVPRTLIIYLPFLLLSIICRLNQSAFIRERDDASERRPVSLVILQMLVVLICSISVVFCAFYTESSFNVLAAFKSSIGKTQIYEQYYVAPESVKLTAGEKKKNLLCIYIDSMETSYSSFDFGGRQNRNYIPCLTELAYNNVSFSDGEGLGGFRAGIGSGWTNAALFSMTTGIPYIFSAGEKVSVDRVTSLEDILKKEGYTQEFLCSSDLGIKDKILFERAKVELLKLAEAEEPFSLTMLAGDMYRINGCVCELCQDTYHEQLANVVACTDRQISGFVEWCRNQSFYKDTVIVIAGVHPGMEATTLVENIAYYDRTMYNCFINVSLDMENVKLNNREFMAQDMLPTVLAAMGYKIEGNRLGLGTNLFSEEPTLAELKGYEWIQQEYAKVSDFYNTLCIAE